MLNNDFMLLSCVRINDYDDLTLAKWPFPLHGAHAVLLMTPLSFMTYINTQCSASKYTITACRAKAKFKFQSGRRQNYRQMSFLHCFNGLFIDAIHICDDRRIVLMGTLEVNIFS